MYVVFVCVTDFSRFKIETIFLNLEKSVTLMLENYILVNNVANTNISQYNNMVQIYRNTFYRGEGVN